MTGAAALVVSFASLAALAALAGCSPQGPAADGADAPPCEIAALLRARCAQCHGATPAFGAPMPLVTAADFARRGASDPSVRVADLTAARIDDPRRPMPPTGPLPDAERDVLRRWLAAGAPARSGPCADASSPDAAAATDAASAGGAAALPCAPGAQRSFTAHGPDGAADPGFAVPVDAANLYECFAWRSPFAAGEQLTAYAPVIDDARVLHHWILYQTAVAQPEGAGHPCAMPPDATFIAGWAPGADGLVLPEDVGLELPGADRWLILQVHYWNVAGHADVHDRSGVAVCTTTTPRAHVAGVMTTGSLDIALPARSTDVEVAGTCTPETTAPIHVLGAAPHMHRLGTSFTTEVLRGGDPARAETLIALPRWDFEAQRTYPVDVLVQPGDVLRTRCRYTNPTSATVYFGEATEDEMCFDFVTAWPAEALGNHVGRAARRCIDAD